ncbi:hypothetical protein FRC01_005613, partial [Tulasnella sp. 417]
MPSPSSSRTPPTPALDGALDTPTFIDHKDKADELQGDFKYPEEGVRIIGDLTEIHEVTWVTPNGKSLLAYIKYLRYVTNIEGDIHMTTSSKQTELKRILGQMKTWTSLKHPNVLPFLGYQWKDTPVLAFHWYQNGNISQYLKANPRVARLPLLADVAAGLVFLHSNSIVHGAIKPTNVIIADDGRPMLMDFGMAPDLRMVERNMTMADSGRENVGYMSPELIEEGNYTCASDVYAFGSLVLEIQSGHPPHYKLSHDKAIVQITQQKKPSPEDHHDLPSTSPLWELMQRCWSTSPDERPKIAEVGELLGSMVKSKRLGLFGYLGSLCRSVFHLVLQLIRQLASLKQADSIDESALERGVGSTEPLPSLDGELNPIGHTEWGGCNKVNQSASSVQSDLVDDSILQPGVQLNELPPPLEGELHRIKWEACGGYGK